MSSVAFYIRTIFFRIVLPTVLPPTSLPDFKIPTPLPMICPTTEPLETAKTALASSRAAVPSSATVEPSSVSSTPSTSSQTEIMTSRVVEASTEAQLRTERPSELLQVLLPPRISKG